MMRGVQLKACFALLAVASILSGPALAREPFDHPNVVIVYLDDSGYGDYSHNGNPVIETPTISRLAHDGVSFTQFYVTSPACSASRYSLLTGRYPGRSGLGSWVIGPEARQHLRPQEVTLATGLKARGYATAMFGKWHLGNPNEKNGMSTNALPLAHGFDTWIGSNVSHDYDNAQLLQADPAGHTPVAGYSEIARNLPSNPAVCNSLTSRYTQAAEEFIRANHERPFFIYFAPNQPHLGLYVSEAFRGKSRRGLLGDVMAELDDSVRRLVAALEQAGVAKNTLVIFSSDNGPWILYQDTAKHPKYGEARLHVGYAQPFRDGKGSNWEGGHRVPGIFYWPGVLGSARQLEPASTLDVLPTVFALCGATAPPGLDGLDIRPLLAPERFPGAVPPFVFAYADARNRPAALREGPWKLHVRISSQTGNNYGFKASRETPLLFNVEQDLGERIDRAAEHPEIVARLLKKLDAVEASLEAN
jgi:arylsulfatase A